MNPRIIHYEVTKGYGSKVKEGLRFDVNTKGNSSKPYDSEIAEGLAEAAGISINEANTARCNIKYEEI
jgi:hypothetical protein